MIVPIFINVRDRFTVTRALTQWCLSLPDVSVHLVDNASTYPPLLEWYKQTTATVHHLKANLGPTGVFKPMRGIVRKGYYALSDCDIDPTGIPDDVIIRACCILENRPEIRKVGLALRIDDLPDNSLTLRVRETEAKYWEREEIIDGIPCYHGAIDTTFCVVRYGESHGYEPAIRMAGDYTARHIPWYYDEHNLPEDEDYYLKRANMHALYYSPALKKRLQ